MIHFLINSVKLLKKSAFFLRQGEHSISLDEDMRYFHIHDKPPSLHMVLSGGLRG